MSVNRRRLSGVFDGGAVRQRRRIYPARLIHLAALTVIVLTGCTTQPITTTVPYVEPPVIPDPAAGLGALLDSVSVRDDAGAVMVAVIDDDGATFVSRGSDPEGQQLTPDSPFRIGGVAAMFAELTILALADGGLMDLDSPANHYLDGTGVPDAVTVADLVRHTSGIPDYAMSIETTERLLDVASVMWTPANAIHAIAGRTARYTHGVRTEFPAADIQLLSRLIEDSTGMGFAPAMRRYLITDLDLASSHFEGFEQGPPPLGGYTAMAAGFDSVVAADYRRVTWTRDTWTAGGMISTARDLHLVFRAVSEGVLGDRSSALWQGSPGRSAGVVGYADAVPGATTVVVHSPRTSKTAVLMITSDEAAYETVIPSLIELVG